MLKWIAGSLAAVLLVSVAGGYLVYRHLSGNITHYDPSKHIHVSQPPKLGKAQNILLIGSDTRAFAGGNKFGRNIAGARSDTAILVHLAADGGKAILVSIPRDSYVRIPTCETSSGALSTPQDNKFNAAYAIGGPACTIATVETLTGIRVDHFVEVNFAGFKKMVNALGGVNVCISHAINDPIRQVGGHYQGSGLVLDPGTHTLKGDQALQFVRARYGVGDGSDLGRIKNQQLFLSSVIRKATSAGLLLDPIALLRFLDAATRSIQTDPHFGLPQLKNLANRLHGLKPGKVALLTVPLADTNATRAIGGSNASVVVWDDSRARSLWQALRTDGPLPGTEPKPTATPTPSASASPLLVAPAAIRVRVLNGTRQPGLAAKAADGLRAEGFRVVAVGNADSSSYANTFVRYGPDKNESSQTVAAAVPGATRQLDGSLSDTLYLVVGSDFHAVVPVQVSTPTAAPTPQPSASLDVVTADRDVCAA